MISYEDFLANAEAEDVRVLNLLSQGQALRFDNPVEADAMFDRITRLDSAGFILSAERGYKHEGPVLWQSFTALVDPAAGVYLARCAAERLVLSRDPLPQA